MMTEMKLINSKRHLGIQRPECQKLDIPPGVFPNCHQDHHARYRNSRGCYRYLGV